eukprot:SAG31_NODE_20212_length_581_cov_0.742739_1_plen_28_part_10
MYFKIRPTAHTGGWRVTDAPGGNHSQAM